MTVFKKDLLNTNVPSIGENNPDIFLQKKKKPNPEQNKPPKTQNKTKSKNSV